MLQSRKRHRGVLRQLWGLAMVALAAGFVWWLLNLAFPDRMQTLIAAIRDLL